MRKKILFGVMVLTSITISAMQNNDGCDIDYYSDPLSSPDVHQKLDFFDAIKKGDENRVQELIDNGEDCGQINDEGFTPLHVAVISGKIVKVLKNNDSYSKDLHKDILRVALDCHKRFGKREGIIQTLLEGEDDSIKETALLNATQQYEAHKKTVIIIERAFGASPSLKGVPDLMQRLENAKKEMNQYQSMVEMLSQANKIKKEKEKE